MPVNWERIKKEYIVGCESYEGIAKRNGVQFRTLADRAGVEGWRKQRKEYREKQREKYVEKVAEKTADTEAEIAAAKARIRLNIIGQIEKRLSLDDVDTADFRRLVQCYKDMEEIDVDRTETNESEAFDELVALIGGGEE